MNFCLIPFISETRNGKNRPLRLQPMQPKQYNFHMEGRHHLHLSETKVRILLP